MIGRVLACVALLATGVSAASDVATRCCADRLRAAGSREKQLLACHARAAARGQAVDPACLVKVDDSLARTFGKIEAGDGCPGSGNEAATSADLDRLVGVIAVALRPTAAVSACAARKLKATGRFASTTARLFAGQAPYPADHLDVLDPLTLRYGQQFLATIATLDARTDCLTTGDGTRLVQLVTIGNYQPLPFAPPDGMLLTAARVCPRCGDQAQGGAEQCDGIDATACAGPCHADCTCPVCGDGVKNQATEICDGADAGACPGLCQGDCTCPAPVCGNDVKEAGEECDGAAPNDCGAACQSDCTCPPAVCGNGVIEHGEQCDSTPTCTTEGVSGFGCSAACQCCDGGYCQLLGCCNPNETCIPTPGFGRGFCQPTPPPIVCTTSADCAPGYTCLPYPNPPPSLNVCFANPGSACPTIYDPQQGFVYTFPCVPPGICTGTVCCLPVANTCSADAECCNGTCASDTCN